MARRRASHALARVYERMAQLDSGGAPARLVFLQIGDSHTASDTSTGRLRELLQVRFGDGGRGYAFAGLPWERYRQRHMGYRMSAGWRGVNGMRSSQGAFGMGGARVETGARGETIVRETCDRCEVGRTFSRLVIHYLEQPGGGRVRVRVDGDEAGLIVSDGVASDLGVFEWTGVDGPHRVELETLDRAPVTIFGIATERERGVVVEAMGINGAQARHFLRFDERLTAAEVAARAPDVLLFAFGPNEAYSSRYQVRRPDEEVFELLEKLDAYRVEYGELIARYRAGAPDAACLVLLPPDMTPRAGEDRCVPQRFDAEPIRGELCVRQPPYNYGGIINAQRYAAAEAGCAVWDQQQAMGGPGGMHIWQELRLGAADGVHLTSRGYDRLAEGLFADLVDNWTRWMSDEPEPLGTTVLHPELAITASRGR